MMKFRKKPVVVEAFQWKGDAAQAFLDTIGFAKEITVDGDSLFIKTLEGTMEASKGDWIIRGVQGELYPCKPNIFEQTYELVE